MPARHSAWSSLLVQQVLIGASVVLARREFLEVFKFNADAAGNSGQAEASGSIVIGDLLVAVNDRPLSGLSKLEVCAHRKPD